MAISQFAFFGEVVLGGGGFPYSVEHMAGGGPVRVKPHAPIYTYTEHAQFVDVS